ncbi:N-acetyltransferase [Helicovermis profundi]|uniref:N-acetyltransferase domain-containing protein n=1 Tax=Helicovermis profundi TaxID=3065157 RepID=A0AAU9E4U8_9FIRM|nr:hypothetical protein HLPR_13710 [Clostridia bacterium S502]
MTGDAINADTHKKYEYKIIKLNYKWLDKILCLQDLIYDNMQNKDIYEKITEFELIDAFSGNGLCLGTIIEKQLVAFRILSYGDSETIELAKDCNIKEIHQVAFIEATIVKKNFRGNSLQKIMMKLTMDYLKKRRKFKYALSTVSPKNIASIKSLLANGFKLIKLSKMYKGKLRYVCSYDFTNKVSNKEQTTTLKFDDYENIHNLLLDGFYGERVIIDENSFYIEFSK